MTYLKIHTVFVKTMKQVRKTDNKIRVDIDDRFLILSANN